MVADENASGLEIFFILSGQSNMLSGRGGLQSGQWTMYTGSGGNGIVPKELWHRAGQALLSGEWQFLNGKKLKNLFVMTSIQVGWVVLSHPHFFQRAKNHLFSKVFSFSCISAFRASFTWSIDGPKLVPITVGCIKGYSFDLDDRLVLEEKTLVLIEGNVFWSLELNWCSMHVEQASLLELDQVCFNLIRQSWENQQHQQQRLVWFHVQLGGTSMSEWKKGAFRYNTMIQRTKAEHWKRCYGIKVRVIPPTKRQALPLAINWPHFYKSCVHRFAVLWILHHPDKNLDNYVMHWLFFTGGDTMGLSSSSSSSSSSPRNF